MADPKKPEFVIIPDPHGVPVTFVNHVVAAGHAYGVVNLALAVARFSPNASGTVDPDLVMATRLRMDMGCAVQMHDQLGRIIAQAHAQGLVLATTALTSSASPGKSGKPS
jgi:hypothetical protein